MSNDELRIYREEVNILFSYLGVLIFMLLLPLFYTNFVFSGWRDYLLLFTETSVVFTLITTLGSMFLNSYLIPFAVIICNIIKDYVLYPLTKGVKLFYSLLFGS